jgi:sterol desaturase/sphingolipid hydroxylase (fatty acid hydroxylase superfamily)
MRHIGNKRPFGGCKIGLASGRNPAQEKPDVKILESPRHPHVSLRLHGEFIIYPALIAGLAAAALWQASPERYALWLAAFVSGVGLWTLVEYLLHRYVLHHMP